MRNLNGWDWTALIILIVGGVNWGLVGFFGFDLVGAMFGEMSALSRVIYGLVGISAIYIAVISPALAHRISERPVPRGTATPAHKPGV